MKHPAAWLIALLIAGCQPMDMTLSLGQGPSPAPAGGGGGGLLSRPGCPVDSAEALPREIEAVADRRARDALAGEFRALDHALRGGSVSNGELAVGHFVDLCDGLVREGRLADTERARFAGLAGCLAP